VSRNQYFIQFPCSESYLFWKRAFAGHRVNPSRTYIPDP
jgi:hypothetical protein